MKPFSSRRLTFAYALAGILVMLTGARYVYLEEQGNFHAISPGKAYRSAQMDRDELEHYLGKYGIKTVINLRGAHPGEPWYDEEIATCQDMGVGHIDVKMSARRKPSSETISALLQHFETAPRPVLIHCQGGADRTGLAAAIWRTAIDNSPVSEARQELSLLYGHIPYGETQAMDEFFDAWVGKQASLQPGQ